MKKYIKYSLSIIGALVALYIIAIILINSFINPNDYRTLIAKYFYRSTGYHMTIKGDISLSMFPWIGLRVQQVQIDNPKSFVVNKNANYLAKIGEADFKFSLFPLFIGQVTPRKIILDNTTLNLVVLRTGKTNWAALITKEPTRATVKPENEIAKVTAPKRLKISKNEIPRVVISNATIHLINQQMHRITTISQFNLRTSAIYAGRETSLKFNFKLKQNNPKVILNLKGSTSGRLNFTDQYLQLNRFHIEGKLYELNRKLAKPVYFELATNLIANFQQQKLALHKLKIELANLKAKGNIIANKIQTHPSAKGKIEIPSFNLARLLKALATKWQPKNKNVLRKASMSFEFKASPTQIFVNSFKAVIDQFRLVGNAKLNAARNINADFKLIQLKQPGQTNLRIYGDLQNKAPRININLDSNNVAISPILEILQGSSFITGKLNMKNRLYTTGNTMDSWLRRLNGRGNCTITNGTIKHIDLTSMVAKGLAFLKQKPIKTANGGKTNFASIKADYNINNGMVNNYKLQINADKLNAAGKGTLYLPTQAINYDIVANFAGTKFAIPIIIRGTLNSPSVRPNIAKLGEMIIKDNVQKRVGSFFDRLFK